MKPSPVEKRLQLLGWLVFIASALSYTASTWLNGDPLGLAGSLLFLLACLIFLLPLLRSPG